MAKQSKQKQPKQQRQEMWWVILAKSKTLRFFAVSCEFILFLGGLWITFTVNDPSAKTWLSGNVNMLFLTVMGWAIDAAMPEAWLHVVIQHVQKERGQLSWSKFVAICISLLFIGNIVYSILTTGDTSDKVGAPTDATGWILLCLTILRITVGFVYITVRQCQEWIKRQSPDAASPPALIDPIDSWSLVGLAAWLRSEFEQDLTELQTAQSQRVNLVDLQVQRLLTEVQDLQESQIDSEPAIDYQQLALALNPLFERRMEASVSAIKTTIIEEVKATLPLVPESVQIESRVRSQGQKSSGSRATKKVDPEPFSDPGSVYSSRGNKEPEERLQAAYELLLQNSIRVSGRLLAKEAHVNRVTANKWLSERAEPVSQMDLESGSIVDSEPA